MRTVSITLNDMAIANIQLGFVGENNTTQVIFNCKEIFENNPNAVQSLTVTPPEGEAYPVVTTRVGDTVVWTVSSSDTAYDGEGNVQLTFTDGSEVIKTYNAKTTILESATPGGTAPDPVQNWIDEAEAVLESLDGLTVEAETLEPGSSATAEVSEDPEDGHRHIDFGIPQGEKGDTGETPSFSIGTVTTGAAGSDASASITGTDEEPVLNLTIPQGLKGDAGNGDMLAPAYSTSATYKAGEYVTYNGGLYCCISDISTAESWTAAHWRSTDFGKDVSALKSAFNDITGNSIIEMSESGRYINLSGTTADVNNPSTTSNHVRYGAIRCSQGDIFTISASGGYGSRAYGFVAQNGSILRVAPELYTCDNLVLTAPANSYWLVVNDQSNPWKISYIGKLLDTRVSETQAEAGNNKLIKNGSIKPTFVPSGVIWVNKTIDSNGNLSQNTDSTRAITQNLIDVSGYTRIEWTASAI